MATTLWSAIVPAPAMRLSATGLAGGQSPAVLAVVGGQPVIQFAPGAGSDLAVHVPCGVIGGYQSAAALKAQVWWWTAGTAGNVAWRAHLAAMRAGRSMASGPVYSATAVDWAVTAVPGTAHHLAVSTVTVPLAAQDGLVDGEDLSLRLALRDTESTLASALYLARVRVWQEV